MEIRIAKLEKRWPQPARTPGPVYDWSALTVSERYELDQLLALVERREDLWRPGRALTPKEERRLEALCSRVIVAEAQEREE